MTFIRSSTNYEYNQLLTYGFSAIYDFAAALFLGEIGGIDQTTLKNMRFAGISHILCVSGLHLSLVSAIFFITSRFYNPRYTREVVRKIRLIYE